MNKDNAKDYLPLVQALAEGKVIQFNNTSMHSNWMDVAVIDGFHPANHYRIKPESIEGWVHKSLQLCAEHPFDSDEKACAYGWIKVREVMDGS